ncbi:MAG: PD-(D/E)XK nuclease family protein [Legionellaceae bacterium]|nr:PD-(D/E)XK nuclease family protein [Legionellaceae bacterium]
MDNKDTLLAEMKRGAIVISPNNRLANQLLRDYCDKYTEENAAIAKPACLPYQKYLENNYNTIKHTYHTVSHPVLLTKLQQRYLWQQLLSKDGNYSFNTGLLNQIQDAWRRCQDWCIALDDESFLQTSQTRQFQIWQQNFQQKLNDINAITSEQLANYSLQYPIKSLQNSPNRIIWACFDDYTPKQKILQESLISQGFSISHYDLALKFSNPQTLVAKDKQDEYQQMLSWIEECLSRGDKQIGVVVPNLADDEKFLKRLFKQKISASQFNISLGRSLLEFPLIAHAIQWLSLDNQSINNHQARLLLNSPYLIGAKSEFIARSEILQNSKLLTNSSISFKDFIEECKARSPILATSLSELKPYPDNVHPLDWVNYFKERLTSLGFPGEDSLSSPSYQSLQRLISLLDEFAELAVINDNMNAEEAITALNNLAVENIFQLQQPPTPITVLGLLEASGCTFDSIWMCNLNDKCLPSKTNFSSFIPIDLQRELSMPHASTERELQFAKQQLQRLQNSCNNIVFSYAKFVDDIPMLACPLINSYPEFEPYANHNKRTKTELIQAEESYQVPVLDTEVVTGGTYLLANQAKCPFKAFAAHRLHATSPEDISEGPNAMERGQIIHKIMEQLWIKLESQQKLLSLSDSSLQELIEETILTTIELSADSEELSLTSVSQDVEISRLKRLVNAALEWDKQRPAFKVHAIEEKFCINLAGIDFQVRVDRIDSIIDYNLSEESEKAVIDYKSRLPSSKPWNEDRPEEPQLLLYALLDNKISAILFLQLKTANIIASGLSSQKSEIKGIQTIKKDHKWQDYQELWQQQLLDLAQEFKQGKCIPQPSKTSVCTLCSFKNLCRI